MLSYTHFTLEERKYLQELLEKGYSLRKIASFLGRAPSSVSREIARNRSKTKCKADNPYHYHHWRAQILTTTRRRQQRQTALPPGSPVYCYVVEKLNEYWSPEEIAMRWRLEHPEQTLGTSTIYRYIWRNALPGIRKKTHLRRRGKNRHLVHHNCNVIHPDRRIPEWPEEIVTRSRIGDWEGDTVYGGIGKGLIVTLVDRKSRYLRACLVQSRDAGQIREAIHAALKGMPVMSVSLDNGSEFSQFREVERELDTLVYFAEPHKPWQRGTNENTNGLLRFFFPKGFDFHAITDETLQAVVASINNRPRKCLGWRTPSEIFSVALA